jgi:hypothetical protein
MQGVFDERYNIWSSSLRTFLRRSCNFHTASFDVIRTRISKRGRWRGKASLGVFLKPAKTGQDGVCSNLLTNSILQTTQNWIRLLQCSTICTGWPNLEISIVKGQDIRHATFTFPDSISEYATKKIPRIILKFSLTWDSMCLRCGNAHSDTGNAHLGTSFTPLFGLMTSRCAL